MTQQRLRTKGFKITRSLRTVTLVTAVVVSLAMNLVWTSANGQTIAAQKSALNTRVNNNVTNKTVADKVRADSLGACLLASLTFSKNIYDSNTIARTGSIVLVSGLKKDSVDGAGVYFKTSGVSKLSMYSNAQSGVIGFNNSGFRDSLSIATLTANRAVNFRDKSGDVMLTNDSATLNYATKAYANTAGGSQTLQQVTTNGASSANAITIGAGNINSIIESRAIYITQNNGYGNQNIRIASENDTGIVYFRDGAATYATTVSAIHPTQNNSIWLQNRSGVVAFTTNCQLRTATVTGTGATSTVSFTSAVSGTLVVCSFSSATAGIAITDCSISGSTVTIHTIAPLAIGTFNVTYWVQ